MLDQAVRDAIHKEIMDRVHDNQLFTAYDITKAVRKKDHFLLHEDSKTEVHEYFEQNRFPGGTMSHYAKTLITIPGDPTQPNCYHPVDIDPITYDRNAGEPHLPNGVPPMTLGSASATLLPADAALTGLVPAGVPVKSDWQLAYEKKHGKLPRGADKKLANRVKGKKLRCAGDALPLMVDYSEKSLTGLLEDYCKRNGIDVDAALQDKLTAFVKKEMGRQKNPNVFIAAITFDHANAWGRRFTKSI